MSREDVLAALQALHHHPDGAIKKQASAWLEAWQQGLGAWSVADGVLHDPNASLEAQHFCAQTLRTKVQRDFEELPPEAASALRDSLVELLLRYASGSAPVRTQLCLAIAALAAHMPPQRWAPAGSAVAWLVQRLTKEPEQAALPCLLELLTVLPQEAGSYRPSVRPERRRQMAAELAGATPAALQLLASILSQHPGAMVKQRVLAAFAEWLRLGEMKPADAGALAAHPLTAAALEGLGDPEAFDGACDAVVELVYVSSAGPAWGEPDQAAMPLVARVVPAVLELLPRFSACVQTARAHAEGREASGGAASDEEEDEETAKGMARLFAEVGEAYTGLIASGTAEAVKPVEALLAVAAHPELAPMSFNFWHRLARALTSSFAAPGGGAAPEGRAAAAQADPAERHRRLTLFAPAFTQLVGLVRGRVAFPHDWNSMQADDRDDFKHRRQAVADTLVDAACVLGGERTLQLLTEPLAGLNGGDGFDWRTAEAALYCVSAVNSKAPPPGNALLLQLLSSLPQLPDNFPLLRHTAAFVLAYYGEWMAESEAAGQLPPELVPRLLQMLTASLLHKETAGGAASALRCLCNALGPSLARHLDALMALYARVQSCGEASASFGAGPAAPLPPGQRALEEGTVQHVVEAVALVVSHTNGAQREGLAALMSPLVTALQHLLSQQQQNGGASANGGSTVPENKENAGPGGLDIALALPIVDRMAILFRYIKDPDVVAEALARVWPLLSAAIEHAAGNTRAMEHLLRCPRYALRTAGRSAAPLLPTLAQALPAWFEASRHSCFLYVASELVKSFGGSGDEAQLQQLGVLFQRLVGASCAQLQHLLAVDAEPDIADDTFLLAGRGLAYCPRIVLNQATLPALLDAASAGILVQHREACCSILTFLTRLFEPKLLLACSPEAATIITAAVVPRAPNLVRKLLSGAVGSLPAPRIRDVTDVLAAMLQAMPEQTLQWLGAAVDLIPEEAATAADRAQLLTLARATAQQAPGSRRQLEDGMEELSELIRRNRRSLDAAQYPLLHGLPY